MASVSGNGAKGHHKFTLSVTEKSQSIADNKSTVSFTFKISPIQTSWNWEQWGSSISYTVNINGTKYTGTIPAYDGSSTVTLKSGTQEVTHTANGTKSISFSFSVTDGTGQSYTCGNASGSGTLTLTKIPRYATANQTLKSKTETTITMNWSSDSTIDYIWYSTNDGSSWTGINVTDGKSGSYTISGLSPNTTYKIKTSVRRKDSQLTTDSSALSVATYGYPYCNGTGNFTIGDNVTISLYNPLGRSVSISMIANGKEISVGSGFSGTLYTIATLGATIQNALYASIPNAQSGAYSIKVVYGSSAITKSYGHTYKVKGTEKPTVGSLSYADTNTTVTAITGNNQHIVQNQSNLKVTYGVATAKNSATISKYTFEVNGVKKESTSAGGTVDFGKVNSSKNLTLKMTVTDSRGLTASATKTITFLAHSNPSAIVTLKRLNNYEDETYLTVDGSVSSVNGKNTMAIKYKYKVSGGSYNSFVTIGDKVKQTLSLDKNNSYIFNVVVTDIFGSSHNKEYALGKGVFPLFIDTVLNSIGINKLPTRPNALEIDGKIYGSQNHLLWSGADLMGADVIQNLSEPISEQANGIVLVFSYYTDGSANNYNFHTFFVSKYEVAMHNGGGHNFPMFTVSFSTAGNKYIYIADTYVKGYSTNTSAGTGVNGIKYDNSRFCLRYVIGV